MNAAPKLVPLAEAEAAARPGLVSLTVAEMLAQPFPPKEYVLEPIIPTAGLVMVYAARGVGKTHFALSLAHAVASGGKFLKWSAPKPRRVLYLDGEMTGAAMQERTAAIIASASGEMPSDDFLRFITPDVQQMAMPDISTQEGQQQIEPHFEGVELVIVDNLSTLVRGVVENESEGWLPVQGWALSLRCRGIAVVFVHHAGKGGAQRGTSRREDVLDTVISLQRPSDYEPEQGARFEIHLEKARHVVGDAAKGLEATYSTVDQAATWTWAELADKTYERAVTMFKDGLNVREVADELRVGKSTAGRLRQRAKAEGLINE